MATAYVEPGPDHCQDNKLKTTAICSRILLPRTVHRHEDPLNGMMNRHLNLRYPTVTGLVKHLCCLLSHLRSSYRYSTRCELSQFFLHEHSPVFFSNNIYLLEKSILTFIPTRACYLTMEDGYEKGWEPSRTCIYIYVSAASIYLVYLISILRHGSWNYGRSTRVGVYWNWS